MYNFIVTLVSTFKVLILWVPSCNYINTIRQHFCYWISRYSLISMYNAIFFYSKILANNKCSAKNTPYIEAFWIRREWHQSKVKSTFLPRNAYTFGASLVISQYLRDQEKIDFYWNSCHKEHITWRTELYKEFYTFLHIRTLYLPSYY